MSEKEIQYALFYKNGKPVNIGHQDDEENPCVGDSIKGLLDWASERVGDMDTLDFLEEMKPGGEFEDMCVKRQEIRTFELKPKELKFLSDFHNGLAKEHDEWESEFNRRHSIS